MPQHRRVPFLSLEACACACVDVDVDVARALVPPTWCTPTTSPSIGMLLVFTIELSQLRRSRFEPTEAHDYEARQARTKSSAMAAFRAHT